jgi:hypothetical protein
MGSLEELFRFARRELYSESILSDYEDQVQLFENTIRKLISDQNEKSEGQVQLEQRVRQLPSDYIVRAYIDSEKFLHNEDYKTGFLECAEWMRNQAKQSA